MGFSSLMAESEAGRLADAARGGGDGSKEAKEALLAAYGPVIDHFVRRFCWRGVSADDLRQEAAIGLLEALGSFDPERGPLWHWVAQKVRWRCWGEAKRCVGRPRWVPIEEGAEGGPSSALADPAGSAEETVLDALDEAELAAALAALHQMVPEAVGAAGGCSPARQRAGRAVASHPAALGAISEARRSALRAGTVLR